MSLYQNASCTFPYCYDKFNYLLRMYRINFKGTYPIIIDPKAQYLNGKPNSVIYYMRKQDAFTLLAQYHTKVLTSKSLINNFDLSFSSHPLVKRIIEFRIPAAKNLS